MQQAIYCFRKIISIDPKDVDALWDRSFLLKETGYLRNVRLSLALRQSVSPSSGYRL